MPTTIDFKLAIKNYKIVDNREIGVLDITRPDDSNYHFQIFFEQNNNRLNLNEVNAQLKEFNSEVQGRKFFDKEKALHHFVDLGFDVKTTAIIEKKEGASLARFKLDEEKKSKQVSDKNLLNVFVLETISKEDKTYYLGCEIPKDFTGNNVPLCSISTYATGKESLPTLSERIYLFPTGSLSDVIRDLKNSETFALENLNIPYVTNTQPFSRDNSHNEEIQTRINLQTIISEEIIRLKQDTRESAKKKIEVFSSISRKISDNTDLDQLGNDLDSADVKEKLLVHRDRLSFFINHFFKFKTHSERALEELRGMLPKHHTESISTTTQRLG